MIGTKRTPAPLPHVEKVYPPEQTDDVLAASDFVLLLLPSTPETENFINKDRLRAMKPTAWLLNFARGALIVDADLIAAVQSKTIAGAVLDVFREEPLPATHPFWQTEGILRAAASRRRASRAQCGRRRNLRRECAAFSRRESPAYGRGSRAGLLRVTGDCVTV